HRRHTQRRIALDRYSSSEDAINNWLRAKSQIHLILPKSDALPEADKPYRLEGAQLLQLSGKDAAYIAYQMPTGPVSLMVAPNSIAIASGGMVLHFQKVSFHYSTVNGYKVVTWSVHGLTYALVSEEGNHTQRSCMVCHSAMGDRDLTRVPTPLVTEE